MTPLIDSMTPYGHELLYWLIDLLPNCEIPEEPCPQTTGSLWKTMAGPEIFPSSISVEQMSLS